MATVSVIIIAVVVIVAVLFSRYHFVPVFSSFYDNGVFTVPDTETDTDTDKNELCRIVWRCSHCTDTNTDTNTDTDYY